MAGRKALPAGERTVVLSFRLRSDDADALRRHAEETGQQHTELIREAVRRLLEAEAPVAS